jgi:heme-degrading monooxygenase HmoA
LVREGSEEDFVERWTTLIEWSLNNAPGAESFVLVRSTDEPRRFLSLGAWENQDARVARDASDAGVVRSMPGVMRRG